MPNKHCFKCHECGHIFEQGQYPIQIKLGKDRALAEALRGLSETSNICRKCIKKRLSTPEMQEAWRNAIVKKYISINPLNGNLCRNTKYPILASRKRCAKQRSVPKVS